MNSLHKPDAVFARLFLPQKLQPGTCYIPSQFTLPFVHNGKSYVFNVLTKEFLQAELPAKTYAGEIYDALIKAMFLVPEDKDECAYYESVFSMLRLYAGQKKTASYTIFPTLGCNARCVYCYEEGRLRGTMTHTVAEQTLQYILHSHDNEPVSITWFGGEPLLCPDILDFISDGLQDAGVPYKSSVISNGSLITPDISEKMLSRWHVKRIQISMDGAEQDYIARKRYTGGHDQYHTVMQAADSLSAVGIPVYIRCNADEENWPGISRFLEDLSRNIEHKQNVSIYFSPLKNVRAGEDDLAFWKKVISARPLIEQAGFHPLSYMGLSMKLRINRCMADGGETAIAPDGTLYFCEHCSPESRFGDIFNGISEEKVRQAFCRPERTREKCRKCPFLPECTSFASCPWKDTHCRELRELIALDTLKRMADSKELPAEDTDEPGLSC